LRNRKVHTLCKNFPFLYGKGINITCDRDLGLFNKDKYF
jgi:hypothetical protein